MLYGTVRNGRDLSVVHVGLRAVSVGTSSGRWRTRIRVGLRVGCGAVLAQARPLRGWTEVGTWMGVCGRGAVWWSWRGLVWE